MRAKLAYFVIILSGLGVLLSAGSPFLIRARTYYQFHPLAMDSAVDKAVAAELRYATPSLLLGFMLSVAGVFIGIGLLRRREWARRWWLFVCTIWLLAAVVFFALAPSASGILPLAFRLIIVAVSFRILMLPIVRNEFSHQHCDPKRA